MMRTFWFKASTKLKIFILEAYLRPLRPNDMLRLGTYYGGWWIPEVRPGGVAVCVGAGTDVTFDLELRRLGYRVITVDPTPAATEYLEQFRGELELVPVGVWTSTGSVTFSRDAVFDESWMIGESAPAGTATDSDDTFAVMSVRDLFKHVGVEAADVLKLDIEGAEHRVLRSMLADRILPHTLCVEYDDHRISAVVASTRLLRKNGYTLYQIEGLNYIYVRG